MKYIYEFGDFRMDPAEQLLLQHGRPVALTPKVFETLLILVQSEGRLIEKDGFIRQLWPEVFVEEVTLAQNISQLRKALGDEKNGTSIIQTVHKRGYRFTPAVRKIVCDTSRLSDIANEEQANVVHAENQSATAGRPPAGLIHSQVALTARETPEPTPPPLLDMPESSRRRGFRILGAIVCVAIIVVVAGLVLRARNHRREDVSGPPAQMRMVPILNLPGKVSDPALSPNSEQIAFIWDGENAARRDVNVQLIATGWGMPSRVIEITFVCVCTFRSVGPS